MATTPSILAVTPSTVSFRVTSITVDPVTGEVNVAYSKGAASAPPEPGGGFTFANIDLLKDEVIELVSTLDDDRLLRLFLAITWLRADGTFKAIGNATIYDKWMAIDPAAPQVLKMNAVV